MASAGLNFVSYDMKGESVLCEHPTSAYRYAQVDVTEWYDKYTSWLAATNNS